MSFDLYNPATGDFFASVQEARKADVDLAVNAAAEAFSTWFEKSAFECSAYFYKLADLIEKNADEFRRIDASCMGKPFSVMVRSCSSS